MRLAGSVAAGEESELRFAVERDGEAVRDLEPYLGAYGHLVAIRATDHAYLHVHPIEGSTSEEVAFAVDVPSPGAYRLFLDFRHEGVVRTAAFTLDVPAGTSGAAGGEQHGEDGDDGGH